MLKFAVNKLVQEINRFFIIQQQFREIKEYI